MASDGILETKISPRVAGLAYGLWFVTAALGVLTYLVAGMFLGACTPGCSGI